jgi:GNAT superfamily N-acetyltransferase
MPADEKSEATKALERQAVELAPVLSTLPPGTQVCFIQDGDQIVLYNVNKAFELSKGREPAATIDVAEQAKQIAPRSDPPPADKMLIDPDHALTVDLSYPVLVLESTGAIIDGWHRIYRASQLGIAELPAVVISAGEEQTIRIDPGRPGEPARMNGEISVRPATVDDAEGLADLRYRFAEETNRKGEQSYGDFVAHFGAYFEAALASGRWHAVVAERDGTLLGHAYLQLIDKLPVPGRPHRRMGYVTNVYVEPDLRNAGTGAEIMSEIVRLGREMQLESLILWPTPRSVPFYQRLGFDSTDALELDFQT